MQMSEKYTNTNENNDTKKQFFINNKIRFNVKGKKRLIPLKKSSNSKMVLKIKLNYPKKDLNSHYFNKSDVNKINNIIYSPRNYHNINLENYKSALYSPLTPNKNYKNLSYKLNNDIHYLNNSHDNKPKVILPKLNIINKKQSLIQQKDRSAISKINMKKIFLGDILKGNINDDIIPIKKYNLNADNSHSKSAWHLVTQKGTDNNNDYKNLEELLFNKNIKTYDINKKAGDKYENTKEKHKTRAEKLKEFHRQKLIKVDKLIKKTEKETNDKKKFLNKYIQLMKDNFEKNEEFNTEFM